MSARMSIHTHGEQPTSVIGDRRRGPSRQQRWQLCADMCLEMRADMCMGMCLDMCGDPQRRRQPRVLCMSVRMPAHAHMFRHTPVHKYAVYRYCTHAHAHVPMGHAHWHLGSQPVQACLWIFAHTCLYICLNTHRWAMHVCIKDPDAPTRAL